MTVREKAWAMHMEFRRLAQTEGNEPIQCSRMHFAEWSDKADALFRRIVALETFVRDCAEDEFDRVSGRKRAEAIRLMEGE